MGIKDEKENVPTLTGSNTTIASSTETCLEAAASQAMGVSSITFEQHTTGAA